MSLSRENKTEALVKSVERIELIERGHYAGVRASIAWIHEYARGMNDPHARAVLNTAAFALGVSKPSPAQGAARKEGSSTSLEGGEGNADAR